jgi:hypothetical protein
VSIGRIRPLQLACRLVDARSGHDEDTVIDIGFAYPPSLLQILSYRDEVLCISHVRPLHYQVPSHIRDEDLCNPRHRIALLLASPLQLLVLGTMDLVADHVVNPMCGDQEHPVRMLR